jgi:beta-glucosidase
MRVRSIGWSHRHGLALGTAVVMVVAGLTAGALSASAATTRRVPARPADVSPSCPWLGTTMPISERVSGLMSAMSLDDKIAEMTAQPDPTSGPYAGYEGYVAAQPALCIPGLTEQDGPAGVAAGARGVTQLPAPEAAAATWNPSVVKQYGQVIGTEDWGKGIDFALGPTINILRVPLWGRSYETLGEDPYLSGQLGAADVEGIQTPQGPAGGSVIADVKHFAAYNQERHRKTSADDDIVSERTLQEIYFPAFQAAVQQGQAGSVMCSYAYVNGTAACQNPYLLADVLNQEWGFTGFVRSDGGATDSTVASTNAGLDQERGTDYFGNGLLAGAVAAGWVSLATVNEAVSRILTVMFRSGLFNDAPTGHIDDNVATPADAAVAEKVAEQGTVLLKNANGVLPLSSSITSVAVIGADAGSGAFTAGGGSSRVVTPPSVVTPCQGIQARAGAGVTVSCDEGGVDETGALSSTPSQSFTAPATGTYDFSLTSQGGGQVTVGSQSVVHAPGPLTASAAATTTKRTVVALKVGQKVKVNATYAPVSGDGSVSLTWQTTMPAAQAVSERHAAVTAAASSSAAIVFVNDVETEGVDRTTLSLPNDQDQLIEQVAAVNPDTIVVLNTGGAVTMPWLDQVSGVVEAWYPGQADGSAIAAVLFGDVDPGGKLPMTFPASLADDPVSTPEQYPGVNGQVDYSEGLDVGYRWYDANDVTPLFPFGYGLSYTHFSYSNLKVTPGAVPTADLSSSSPPITVTATVTNTGSVAGTDVAQLYVGDPAAAGEPPRQLKGFQSVTLAPSQSTQVSFPITARDLAYWDDASNDWAVPDGSFEVYVGDSSALPDLPLQQSFQVDASTTPQVVTLTAPSALSAGVDVVSASFANNSDVTDADVNLGLATGTGGAATPESSVAQDLEVTAVSEPSSTSLAPGQQMHETWDVAVPTDMPKGTYQFTATANYSEQGIVTSASNVATSTAPGSPPYDSVGISDNTYATAASFDGAGNSYSEQDLEAAGLFPDANIDRYGLGFVWPDAPAGEADDVTAHGQVVPLAGSGTTLGFLGAADKGNQTGTGTITYTDGTTQSFTLALSDWFDSTPGHGDQTLATVPALDRVDRKPQHSVSVYYTSVPLNPAKAVASVKLPDNSAMHVFSFAVGPTNPLRGAYDNTATSNDTDPKAANFDGAGNSYSEQDLQRAGLTAGAEVGHRGLDFVWPDAAAGQPDNITAKGQSIPVSGSGTTLGFLGAADDGDQSGTGTIRYTDGTTQSFTLELSDWFDSTAGPGDQTLATLPSLDRIDGKPQHHVSVYSTSVRLNPAKQLARVTFPRDPAMHLFSLAVGTQISLRSVYGNTGISNDTDVKAADFDGAGNSYSEQDLKRAGLTPNANVSQHGLAFVWPNEPAGQPDNVTADGQSVTVAGQGSTLGFLGAADGGDQTGTGTILYTDGSTQSFTLSLSDWFYSTAGPGDQTAVTLPSLDRVRGNPRHAVRIYYTSVPIHSLEHVADVVLPYNARMHIFAMALR